MANLCVGYIWGSIDTARKLKVACEPPGVLGQQLIELTKKYFLKHQEQLQLSAATLVANMYRDEFPCS
jgi:hypothetical protein